MKKATVPHLGFLTTQGHLNHTAEPVRAEPPSQPVRPLPTTAYRLQASSAEALLFTIFFFSSKNGLKFHANRL
jgi:hypothetical protein